MLETFKNASDEIVRCQLHLPQRPLKNKPPVLAYVHGIGGSIDSPATKYSMNEVLDNGFAVFRFDATPVRKSLTNPFGFKANTKNLSPYSYVQTIHYALQHLQENHHDDVDMRQLSLHCTSLGAYCGGWYAAHANGLSEDLRIIEEPILEPQNIVFQSPVLNPLGVAEKVVHNPYINYIWGKLGYVPWPIGGEILNVSYRVYEESVGVDFNHDIAPHIHAGVSIHYGLQDPLEKPETIDNFIAHLTQATSIDVHRYDGAGHALEDVQHLQGLPIQTLAKASSKHPWLTRREEGLRHYLLNNFMDVTHCGQATTASVAFLKQHTAPAGLHLKTIA